MGSFRIRFRKLLLSAWVCTSVSVAMALSGLSQEPLSKQEEDFCVVAALLQEAPSKEEKYFKAHYEKHEYRIPMRDGVNLFTSVYEPRDSAQQHPILLTRTPYSVAPYGPDAYASMGDLSFRFVEAGYIFVAQDVRGRYYSEGKFVHMTPEKDQHGRPISMKALTPTIRSTGWSRIFLTTTGEWVCGGSLILDFSLPSE